MIAAAMFVVAVAIDAGRAPDSQVAARMAVAGIHAYQATLSKVYGRMGVVCRFTPTCSHYGEEVIKRFGIARGTWLATKRILRCGPWTPAGTTDPAPLAL
jgi:putative membrane protein insertion efficiency factor